MSEKRTLTIGVAINLGNYESLRLEVSDEVHSDGDAAELAAYLNRILDGYGQNDPSTRASIDKYRARVLERHAVINPTVPAEDSLDELFGPSPSFDEVLPEEEETESFAIPAAAQEEFISEILPASPIPEPVTVEPVPEAVLPEPEPRQEPPVYTAEKTTTTEDPVVYTCEKCGAAVSKVQRDVSNLFMGKTLCKACMK